MGPLFGAVLARAIDDWWNDLGRPSDFAVVEAGAGPGTPARAVLAARPSALDVSGARYVAVEISDVQRASHPDGVESVAVMPDGPIVGVVIANDSSTTCRSALRSTTAPGEAFVQRDGDRFVEVLRPLDGPVPADLPTSGFPTAHGLRCKIEQRPGPPALGCLERGRLVVIDYAVALYGGARPAPLAGVASHLSRARPWRALPARPGHAGHHERGGDRSVGRRRRRP